MIAIEGMKFYAFHGYYPQEQLIGTEFLVDVYVEVNISKAGNSDQLSDTVNYETIYRIVKAEMSKKSKLIEHVAQRIIFKIKSFYAHKSKNFKIKSSFGKSRCKNLCRIA
jgi:dihydroneopterin aldolase